MKLGSRVRVTRSCTLAADTRGVVTWLDGRTAAVMVTEQELAARVPLDAIEVAS